MAKRIEEEEIDSDRPFKWLKSAVMIYDNTTKDKALLMNVLMKILKSTTNFKCRFCKDSVDTVSHPYPDVQN